MSAGVQVPVSGIVLAAGVSKRLGGETPKQLRKLGGEALVRRVTKAAVASRLAEVLVIVGHQADAVAEAVADLDVTVVENPDFRRGQSTSIAAGLARVAPEARAAMFLPADQPLLSTELIDRLLDAYVATGGPIVLPTHRGRRRAPTLFDRFLFFELEGLDGDTGGRSILPRYHSSIVTVPVDDARELDDVDTEDDLRRLRSTLGD